MNKKLFTNLTKALVTLIVISVVYLCMCAVMKQKPGIDSYALTMSLTAIIIHMLDKD